MPELSEEVLTKIVETHTLVKRIDEDHKEYKKIVNARLHNQTTALDLHKADTKEIHEKHDKRIDAGERFRLRVVTYASSAAFVGALIIDPIISGVRKLLGT